MSYTLLEQVKIRLKQFHIEETEDSDTGTKADKVVFDKKEDNPLIEQLLEQAKNEIIEKRNYPETYTQDQIDRDVQKFENVMVNLAVYDRSQAGEAYMASFSENGVSRTWKDRESLFVGVFPFVKAM
jgi:hypothetical protein|nr:MAG TPA_asm: hypothetical protein [Caudoviricetes sp.]